MQAPANPPPTHRNTHEQLCARQPGADKLAEGNHTSLHRDEEDQGQADARVCRSGSEPWQGA